MPNDATIRLKSINSSVTIAKGLTESDVYLNISNLLSIYFTGMVMSGYGIIPSLLSLYPEYINNKYGVCAILKSAYTNGSVSVHFTAIYY